MGKKSQVNMTEQRFKDRAFPDVDIDNERLLQLIGMFANESVRLAKMWVGGCESPIEQIMLVTIAWNLPNYQIAMGFKDIAFRSQEKIQAEGKTYRADFYMEITTHDDRILKLIIECDGHDYHERTKEQARHDKERDRIMKRAGYEVLHYTGSEIYNDPIRCLDDIYKTIDTLLQAGE